MKILHMTTGLENGGAENLLARLVSRMDRAEFENAVISLTDEGPDLGARIRAAGVPLHCLGFRRGLPNPLLIGAAARQIERERPDVIQTWLYHADMVGALAQMIARRRVPLIWGLHNTVLDSAKSKKQTVGVTRLNARLSWRFPDQIVCCAEAVREDHVKMGYDPLKLRVIPNGIDTEEFVPDAPGRTQIRADLGLAAGTPLIGLIARFDPQKDHQTFFRAAGLLHKARPDAHFVLCGRGVTLKNATLKAWAVAHGVLDVTHLLGLRPDTPRVTAALDAATCCSSFGEAFPLVLGEALACGVPAVTTDLPGSVAVLGDLGRVIHVGDAPALARAWQEILELSPEESSAWGREARQRVEDQLSLTRMVKGYEALYRERSRSGAAAMEGEAACC